MVVKPTLLQELVLRPKRRKDSRWSGGADGADGAMVPTVSRLGTSTQHRRVASCSFPALTTLDDLPTS